jgi:hypothetical protein
MIFKANSASGIFVLVCENISEAVYEQAFFYILTSFSLKGQSNEIF